MLAGQLVLNLRTLIAASMLVFASVPSGQAPPQKPGLTPRAVEESSLRVRLDLVGRMPTRTNPTSPCAAGTQLLLIDQAGYLYRWDGSVWGFVAPSAILYADANHHAQVGIHFGTPTGPAWETTSGSRVVEQRVESCTPDATAIPWLSPQRRISMG